jgi:hypothetical protein
MPVRFSKAMLEDDGLVRDAGEVDFLPYFSRRGDTSILDARLQRLA